MAKTRRTPPWLPGLGVRPAPCAWATCRVGRALPPSPSAPARPSRAASITHRARGPHTYIYFPARRQIQAPHADRKFRHTLAKRGFGANSLIPKNAGLQRCWRSCRLRWAKYLRLKLKHGEITDAEEQCIIKLHSVLSDSALALACMWSVIAAQLPGRTSWDVKNHWNTKLKKKLSGWRHPVGQRRCRSSSGGL